jgi:hypothetical protein
MPAVMESLVAVGWLPGQHLLQPVPALATQALAIETLLFMSYFIRKGGLIEFVCQSLGCFWVKELVDHEGRFPFFDLISASWIESIPTPLLRCLLARGLP